MGVTAADILILERYVKLYQPRKVVDLGAQNNFSSGKLPAPYMSEWWKAKEVEYVCIDLNRENGALVGDLAKPFYLTDTILPDLHPELNKELKFDFVMDFGTSEHVTESGMDYINGEFSWGAIYNCWKNKHNLLRVGGIMINENPLTGNWPGHGFNYYTENFYTGFCKMAGYVEIESSLIPAMGNRVDGWNLLSILRKYSDKFPILEEFQTLDLRKN